MDLAGEIADATIEKLKEEEQFANWSDEKFSRLRTLLTMPRPLDTEEEIEEFTDAFLELLTEEDVPIGKKT